MFRVSKCSSSGRLVHAILWYYNTMAYPRITVSVDVYKFFLVISGFRREVDENCSLLGYYAANSGHFLRTLYDNLYVSSVRGKTKKHLKMGPTDCPETSVKVNHYSLRHNPEERSYLVVSRFSWNVNLISACATACRWTRSDAIDSNSFPHILCLQ